MITQEIFDEIGEWHSSLVRTDQLHKVSELMCIRKRGLTPMLLLQELVDEAPAHLKPYLAAYYMLIASVTITQQWDAIVKARANNALKGN